MPPPISNQWDVTIIVNVAGLGEQTITRTVHAGTLEEGLSEGKRDLVIVKLVSIVPH